MAVLSAIFRGVDEMSSTLDRMASSGEAAVSQWERAGGAADSAFSRATSGATGTAQASNGAASSTDNLSEAFEASSRAADEAADSIGNVGDESEEAGQQSEEFGSSSSNAIQGLSKALAAAGIAKGLKEIYDGFMYCSAAAMEFETANAQVATIADTTQMSMNKISSSILDLSNDTGDAAAGLSSAVYQAISAGVDTGSAVEFSATATKLAAGGFTQAATAVDVLTTAINAYGLESSDASKISDMLIVTQNLGKTTVDELAASVGKVIPLASAYGVEMDNLSTAYAQLTAGGVATAEAGTYLKAMLNELGNSSSDVAATLQDETGQSFAMLMEQGYSLGDVLDVLGDSVGGDTTKFNELWGSTEAGVGALSLFNSGSEKFNSVLEQMQNSAGATSKAYQTMSNTTAEAQEDMQTASTNLKTVIGSQLNPTLTKLYEAGATAFSWAGEFLEENPAVTAGLTAVVVGVTAIAGAFAIYSVAQSVATAGTIAHTVAQAALNLVMNANPVFLIITGLVALTAAVVTFVAVLASQETEYESWTAGTRKQYDELENLNSEYDKACEQYGETSEEALRLHNQVDDLTIAFEASKQTVEEFVAECEALVEENQKLIGSYQDSMSEIKDNEVGTLALVQKLSDLASATDKSAASEEQMKAIIGQLNKELPDLALSYDDVTSSTEATVEALKKAAEAEAEQNRFEKSREAYTELLERQAITEDEIAKATENVRIEQEKIQKDGFYTEDSVWASWTTDIDEYRNELEAAEASQAEIDAQLAEITQQWANIYEAAAEAANASVSYDDAVSSAIDGIQGEMDELIAKYDEAYLAARESLDGTVGLFEKAETEAGLSSQGIIEAWQTQIDFFNQYSDSLNQLEQLGVDPELLKELSDGSVESINQVQTLADELGKLDASGAEAAVDNINAKFGELATAKDTAAATMAGIQTDFDAALDALNTKLNESIDKMNMPVEAATAAKSTMDGYINSIKSQQDQAVSAATAVANAVSSALNTTANVKVNVSGGTATVAGNARGTTNAEDIFMAGEEGPELIVGAGGSTVFPTEETNKILSAVGNVPMNVAAPEGMELSSGESNGGNVSERKITLEIAGSGAIDVSGPFDEERLMSLLFSNLKPALMSLLKKEVYEEGDLAYEF